MPSPPRPPAPCACDEFNRAAILRAAAARAGAGLPTIETGMPAPAGTGLSRRSFVARSAGMAMAVFGGSLLSPRAFEVGIEEAAAQAAGGPRKILVSIYLAGGIDSMTLLAPVGHASYAALRPTLAVPASADPADVFTEDTSLQWHPNAAALRDLHLAGRVTVIPAIGYTDPNQSHFTSRHFYEVGETNPFGRVGWLGRFLDRHGTAGNPLQGLSLDYQLAPALAPASVPVAAVPAPESYGFNTREVWDATLRGRMLDGYAALGALPTGDAELAAARFAARQTMTLREQLAPIQGVNVVQAASYPYPSGTFARRLAALAELIETGTQPGGTPLPLKVVAIQANGGYDTHDSQVATLPGDILTMTESIAAFQHDLEARGLADQVLTHVWTEFGRRAQENGSGTDHGAAGISFVIGTKAKGTMAGEFPGIASGQLDARGNLRHTVDFRGVYRGLLEQWFKVDPTGIVPGHASFAAPALAVD